MGRSTSCGCCIAPAAARPGPASAEGQGAVWLLPATCRRGRQDFSEHWFQSTATRLWLWFLVTQCYCSYAVQRCCCEWWSITARLSKIEPCNLLGWLWEPVTLLSSSYALSSQQARVCACSLASLACQILLAHLSGLRNNRDQKSILHLTLWVSPCQPPLSHMIAWPCLPASMLALWWEEHENHWYAQMPTMAQSAIKL